ncbi:hypothetical protein WJX84_006857, partial [Apatococcus fuscideae]
GSRASGPKPAPARASANYSGPVVVRGQQSLPRPITLQPPPRLPRPITLQPPQQRQQPQQPPQQKQQPHMQRQQPQQQRQQSSAEQTQHLPSTSGSMGPPPKKQGLSWEQRRLGPAAATPAAAAEKPSKKRPMTADEIMATADQEYQQQERQHHGLQQAWAVQERRLQGQALADAGKMQPTLRAFVPPQRMSMRPEPAQELGWAVESSEVATQRQRESMEVEAVYVIPELIPDSPAEPWAVHDPIAHVAPALVMPFCPAEKEEAQWQDDALWKAGVRLSSFFADPTASAVSLAPSTQSSGSSNPGGLLWSSGQAQPLLMGEPTQQALQWPFMMQPASYVHQPSYRPPS